VVLELAAGLAGVTIVTVNPALRSEELEHVLFEHEDVADVAVLGVPDATWGEQVAAFIRPPEGARRSPTRCSHTAASASRRSRRRATGGSSTSSR
jgi:acyl-CoA synthetase (AMP-forming)/AMP-acid ligase II